MTRWGIVLGLTLAPAAVLAWLLLAPAGLPPQARYVLEQYLDFQQRTAGEHLTWVAAGRAARPQALQPEWSARVVGNSARYLTTLNFAGTPQAQVAPSSAAELIQGDEGDRVAPPYPPTDAWCLTLRAAGNPAAPPRPVLLVQHADLYNAAWLVHEPSAAHLADFAAVGCPAVAGPAWPAP
jgi:hypothetical protein